MNPNTDITLCVTSCDRHDLLKHTLESFFQCADIQPQQILIYEDSATAMPDWLNAWEYKRRQPFSWISDGERKGQAYACARLIREIKHGWVFWLEDDWLFQRNSGSFMQESKALLNSNPDLIKISVRGAAWGHPLEQDPRGFKIAKPYWHGVWGGWAWNPGLSRSEDVRALLPRLVPEIGESGLKHEEALSKSLLDEGRRIADLGRPIVTHIGGGRSRAVDKLPPLPRILVAVPTCFEFEYESHALKNPEGFHVDGPNEQTQAVRDTWAKDFKAYLSVDVRFFYGKPNRFTHGEGFHPDDSIVLDCGDGYDSLIDKTLGICKWAAERDYSFLYKCDTDTFVYHERLLVEIMETCFDYAGYRHSNVCSGGPGYILSRQAIQIMAHQPPKRHNYAEDVTVAWTLAEASIYPVHLPGHHSGMSAHFFFGQPGNFEPHMIPQNIVTAHAVFPEVMRQWHKWKSKSLQAAA